MKCSTSILLSTALLLVASSLALFPGRAPDRGDYRHLYPRVFIAVGVSSHAHTLPYTLGLLENLEYPKDRLKVAFFLKDNNGADGSKTLVEMWAKSAKNFYRERSIPVFTYEDFDDSNWMELALVRARASKSEYAFLTTPDEFLTQPRLLQHLIGLKKLVVTPLMNSPTSNHSNAVDDMGDRYVGREIVGLEEVAQVSTPVLIHIVASDAAYLTFSAGNVAHFSGDSNDPIAVFAHSAKVMDIPFHITNEQFYGYFIDSTLYDLKQHRQEVKHFIANLISDYGLYPILPSSAIPPRAPRKSLLGFDQIYLINLKRRPERRKKMNAILQLLGIDYTYWEATDGNQLEKDEYAEKIKIMPGYEDPYYKRTLKKGEIGCFLSHYRIWKDVIEHNYQRVLVFEDDLRFLHNGTQRLLETMEDIDFHETEWDLIYLGRKKMAAEGDELWVENHRHLSTVGYSYWTLGYALSHTGAEKLLQADPLSKLVAVDEYIPIMFDRHPRTEWKDAFPERNLKAFTLYPLMVVPERFTDQVGYVSDTEDSAIVDQEHSSRGEHPQSLLKAPPKEEL
uniref:Glycosyltransferase 25 family member n=1 Tax=Steinernema glaseri TaxID=37863 RepID=A0A1I7ZVK3_9BILA